MTTQRSMNLRTTTDSERYFQSGMSRGAVVTLLRSNVLNASAVAGMVASTGYKASGTTNVVDLGSYDSVRMITRVTMSTTATSFDIRARVYTVGTGGTAALLMRRTIAGGIVTDVADFDRFTTNGTFSINYERIGAQFIDFQGRSNGAVGRSFTASVQPYNSVGGAK